MDKEILKGLKIFFGFFIGLISFLIIVYAAGFHNAGEIVSGVFQGDYTFNGTIYFADGTSISSTSSIQPSNYSTGFTLVSLVDNSIGWISDDNSIYDGFSTTSKVDLNNLSGMIYSNVTNSFTTSVITEYYSYTGSVQTTTVPTGVTTVDFKAWGAGGSTRGGAWGGNGGYINALNISVTPGESLNVVVGGSGSSCGGGGRTGLERGATILVAAGGGGGGAYGGNGGHASTTDGSSGPGTGSGGNGGNSGHSLYGTGGYGGGGNCYSDTSSYTASGGGGGYYGGSGGAASGNTGGQGGRSYQGDYGTVSTSGSYGTAPQNSDPDYPGGGVGTSAGNGYAVVSYGAGGGLNGVLISNAINTTSLPTTAKVSIIYNSTGDLNTDIIAYVSRDDGANWLQVNLTDIFTTDVGVHAYGEETFTTEPNGTTMRYKIEGSISPSVEISGVGLTWS